MNHKLLVAVEGGMDSMATVTYAAKACAGAEVPEGGGMIILHVLPPLLASVEGIEAAVVRKLASQIQADRRKTATTMLQELKQRVIQEGVRPEIVATEVAENSGGVLKQILKTATRHGCDTIVVGRSDQSLLREFLAGSIVERLLWKPIGFAIWIVERAPQPKRQ
ncbi:MAG: universal stress protein [Verrucomicrobiota bacterium]|nr:universal stress protein [Verrucomicrobiota bacterium]